ncbi:MAG: hypothetical protein ACI81W_004296, partial [Saprospiraceae bacterium]
MKIKLFISLFFISVIAISACNNNPDSKAVQSNQENSLDKTQQGLYLKKGKTIAAATFANLSGHLQQSLAEGGVPNALKYCNLAAIPLVDSLSQIHQASIRRTSRKVRNPKDKP